MNSISSRFILLCSLSTVCCALVAPAASSGNKQHVPSTPNQPATVSTSPDALLFREINYDGTLSDDEARFTAEFAIESRRNDVVLQNLFEGDLALLPSRLPAPLSMRREGNCYILAVAKAGQYRFKVDLVARIARAEPWNQVSFKGPSAAIARVAASAAGRDVDLQLLTGTLMESGKSNNTVRVKGLLGADRTVGLRWSRAGGREVRHKSVLTVDTTATAQITPTVVKYVTELRYQVIQGKPDNLTIVIPSAQTLTRLSGDQIRDWEIHPTTQDPDSARRGGTGPGQILKVQFIKPVEQECNLTIYSEQTVEGPVAGASVSPPEPVGTERESGSVTLSAEDVLAEIDSASGLRRVNAQAGALAAFRFNGRPFDLRLKLQRIEPVIKVVDKVMAQLEETRLLARHTLDLNVERGGIYTLEFLPQAGFIVTDVRGESVDGWQMMDSQTGTVKLLRVSFSSRLQGARQVQVQLEMPLKTFPDHVELAPLQVSGAASQRAEIAVSSAAGISLKTSESSGLREIPVRMASGESLGYSSEQETWKLKLASERLAARVFAEIFNLATIGDGIVGGSATIRFGLVAQGVQEFQVAIPASWKNIEFTGANIRRKEQSSPGVWTIGLQDKVWGGYTLVATYDYQFDPQGATLALGGIHAKGVERETGTIAVTAAASLKLEAKTVSDSLHRLDESELSTEDRALITRSVLLAYQYSDPKYELAVEVKRFGEAPVLSAVADRTQLTTVLTEAGELLTQASFMVKNNDKQFQRFKLPKGADLWSCRVNGQPVKAGRDGDWVLAPLPRGVNRDLAFDVNIIYAEKEVVAASLLPRSFQLEAPRTDVPNTYAEWEFFTPPAFHISGFGGTMSVARGTTYGLGDAWGRFLFFYRAMFSEAGEGLFIGCGITVLLALIIAAGIRRGASGVITALIVLCICAVLAAMMLPALARAKARAQRISSTNNLKQIGLAARTFALDNNDRLPMSFEEMMNELSTDKITYDPENGQRYIYLGAGLNQSDLLPDSVLAYSPVPNGSTRNVLLADGSVQTISDEKFMEMSRQGLLKPSNPQQVVVNRQVEAIRRMQFQSAQIQAPNAPVQMAEGNAGAVNGPASVLSTAVTRGIRIDLPRTGTSYMFTKVLNVKDEPLAFHVRIVKMRTFQLARMCLQLAAFLGGLALVIWQWRRAHPNSLFLTLALALICGSISDLLIAWRLLHVALIISAPLLTLGALAGMAWRYWPRSARATEPLPPGFAPEIPPAAAVVGLCFLLAAPPGSKAAMAPSAAMSVMSASYSGSITDGSARLDATFRVSSKAGERLALFGNDVAIEQFSSRPAGAQLVRDACGLYVTLPRNGEATLQARLLIKLSGDVTRRRLAFSVPAALTSQFIASIDQPEAEVEFPGAISVKCVTTGQQTRVDAIPGPGECVDLSWTPRVKRAAELAVNVVCHNATLASFSGGELNTRAIIDYQITQGEMRRARVRLPAGHRLLRVEGEAIRTWSITSIPISNSPPQASTEHAPSSEAGAQIIEVELTKPAAQSYRLTIETERSLNPLPGLIAVEIPHAVDVKRESGLVAIRNEEELEVVIERTEELYRVDSGEFSRATGETVSGSHGAFRFLRPEFQLEARVAPVQPQVEATVHYSARVNQDVVTSSAALDYVIKKAGVFSLGLEIPAGCRVENLTGNNVMQWLERFEGTRHFLDVALKERAMGDYGLKVELSWSLKEMPSLLKIEGVRPLQVEKETGFISVSAAPGLAIKPASFDGLTEVPASVVQARDGSAGGSSGSVLAFKYVVSGRQTTSAWNLSVATEAVESWVRAQIVNTLTINDSLVSGRAQARFEIQNAPVRELRLRIPSGFRNVEVSGPNIRRQDQEGEIRTVQFQNTLTGAHVLTITWDQARPVATNLIELNGISADRVERETGVIALVVHPPLQLAEHSSSDLASIDTRDLPEWAGRPDDATVLAYRYLRPGYKLAVEARRFAEASVLQALVEDMNLTTVLADDGQTMTTLSLSVRNRGRQYLEIGLPPGAAVWSAFVAGEPVRPSVRQSKVLMPLDHTEDGDAPLAIEVTFAGTNNFPRARGPVALTSPQLDAPLKAAHWALFLPADYRYSQFAGTMAREITAVSLEAASFSRFEYKQQERQNATEQDNELKSELNNAEQKLSSGNVKEAWADYKRARAKGGFSKAKNSQTQKLEDDLNRAQGGNLINAQNNFSSNGTRGIADTSLLNNNEAAVGYDTAAAQAQWTKLEQAQDVAVAKVQPIHVNLPTRGVRLDFTQVLQTQPNVPLTVKLVASNTSAANWPGRIATAVGAFLGLWLAVAFALRHSPRHASAR